MIVRREADRRLSRLFLTAAAASVLYNFGLVQFERFRKPGTVEGAWILSHANDCYSSKPGPMHKATK